MLLEFSIYLVLLALLLTLLSLLIGLMSVKIEKVCSTMGSSIDIHIAYDLFVKDVHTAPIHKNAWHEYSSDHIQWAWPDQTIEWFIKEKDLIRVQKFLNSTQGAQNTLICSNIGVAKFTITTHRNLVTFVQIELQNAQEHFIGAAVPQTV